MIDIKKTYKTKVGQEVVFTIEEKNGLEIVTGFVLIDDGKLFFWKRMAWDVKTGKPLEGHQNYDLVEIPDQIEEIEEREVTVYLNIYKDTQRFFYESSRAKSWAACFEQIPIATAVPITVKFKVPSR